MKTIYASAALMRDDDRILIALRKKNDANGSLWELPGGKIEEGESPEECLKRELKEEFEIDARIGELFSETGYQYPDFYLNLRVYHVDSYFGELRLNAHEKITWARAQRLDEYDLCPADIQVIEKLTR